MNDVEKIFDYSIVDDTIAQFLKVKEQELQSIVLNSSIQLGEALIEAQDKLAKYGEGTFVKWFESIGLKRQSVYNYINQCKFFHQMEKVEQIEMFQELPTTLKTEISKPSAKQEAVEMVLSGDIKTTKEYRELEKRLKAKDEQIEMQARMIEDLNEQEPQVIEKEVVVERVPSDYESLKSKNERLQSEMRSVKNSLELQKTKYSLLEQSTAEAKLLKENIDSLREQESSLTETVKAITEFNELIKEINHLFDEKMASLRFKPLIDTLYDTEAPNRLRETVDTVDFWVEEMRKILPNKNMKIIEGEIINE